MKKLIGRILCSLGFHKYGCRDEAGIVKCDRCGDISVDLSIVRRDYPVSIFD